MTSIDLSRFDLGVEYKIAAGQCEVCIDYICGYSVEARLSVFSLTHCFRSLTSASRRCHPTTFLLSPSTLALRTYVQFLRRERLPISQVTHSVSRALVNGWSACLLAS